MREYFIRKNGQPFLDNKLRVRFIIEVFPGSALSLAEINIYNLANSAELQHGDSIELIAGYDNRAGVIFSGVIINLFRERDNADIFHRVIARTGTVANRGSSSAMYGEGATIVDVLKDVAKAWPLQLQIDKKQFENAPPFTSGLSLDGDLPTILNSLAREYQFQWVEHVGRLNISKEGDVREGVSSIEISQMTGMEGVPEVNRGPQGLGVTVMKRLDPFVFPNSMIEVKTGFSSFNTGNIYVGEVPEDVTANGVYNVLSLIHRGDTHGEEWTTEIHGLRSSGESEMSEFTEVGDGSLIWGKKVSQGFRAKVREIAGKLRTNPNYLMAVMGAETGGTFNPALRNETPGSTATGLIQFIKSTAEGLGTTTAQLARMSAEQQLDYVYKYYKPFTGKLNTLSDTYITTMYPYGGYQGKPKDFIMFRKPSKEYNMNASLDTKRKGYITIGDVAVRVESYYKQGQKYIG